MSYSPEKSMNTKGLHFPLRFCLQNKLEIISFASDTEKLRRLRGTKEKDMKTSLELYRMI